jgi:uncharacterized membrane protein required for colicin V production
MFESLTVLDGILALLLLIGAIIGLKLGFIGFIAKPIKLIAAGALTVCVSPPILDNWVRPFVTNKVDGLIYNTLIEKCPELTGETATSALPAFLRFLANIFKVDVSALGAEATSEELIHALTGALSTPLGNYIAVAVTYFVLFTVFTIILSILVGIINSAVESAGPLKFINRLLGFVLGSALSIVVACLVANLVGHFAESVPGGFVYTFFKNFNPFELLAKIQIK